MNSQGIKKKIIENLTNKKFYISDGNTKLYGNLIKKIIFEKIKIIKKKNLKGNTIAILKNKCGIIYWVNLIVAYLCNFTIYPEIKSTQISKYYNNIIIFDGENIYFKKKKYKKKNRLNKFDIIFSSSGSTGQPKLILQTFSSLLKNTTFVLDKIKFKKNNNFMMCIPYMYTSAICHFFACIISRTNFYAIEETIFPSDLKEKLIKNNINYFGGPPIHSKWIIDFLSKKLPNLKKLISSGDFLSEETINKFLKKENKLDFFYMYGISEVGGRFCINKIQKNKYKYSVGKPLKYMKIVNKENDQKEIILKSKNLFYGYYTKDKFLKHKSNYYSTGDVGTVKNGNLFLSGRISEIFKSSGVMVYPQFIYKELIKTKWFNEVFIFKGYIKDYGNVPFCAFSSKKKISSEQIIKYLKNKIPNEQIPKKIKQVSKFPRLGNNKIDKQSIINSF